jgi:hypothetical protein
MYKYEAVNKMFISYDQVPVNVCKQIAVGGNWCNHSKTKKGIRSAYMTDMEL